MARYYVTFERVVLEVEADDEEEAVDLAYAAVNDGMEMYVDNVREAE